MCFSFFYYPLASYPTSIGPEILDSNLPHTLKKVPKIMHLLYLATRLFEVASKISSLKIFGARIGYLSKPVTLSKNIILRISNLTRENPLILVN